MALTNTIIKKARGVKNAVVTGTDFYTDSDGVNNIQIGLRPSKWHEDDCPICHKRCPKYDSQSGHPRKWRGLDWGGIIVEVSATTHRIRCPEHGVHVADVPWAYPDSGFTKEFDLTVGWLAVHLSRSTVSEFMRIDWETVGNCVKRSLAEVEPDRSRRLDGLVNIGVDETSYKKGHKYITAVANHDTNTVVRAAQGHGKTVLEQFYKQLSPEQLASIKTVTGDGAQWITECVKELYKKIKRHRGHILNKIRLGMSNARVEATNNKIKLIVRKAYGFRNIQNMLDMVYLVCSDLKAPLPNRKTWAVKPRMRGRVISARFVARHLISSKCMPTMSRLGAKAGALSLGTARCPAGTAT